MSDFSNLAAAVNDCTRRGRRDSKLEQAIVEGAEYALMLQYAKNVAKGRVKIFEDHIFGLDACFLAANYAVVLGRRVMAVEDFIAQGASAMAAAVYSRQILRRRNKRMEAVIAKYDQLGYDIAEYTAYVAKCRVPAFEQCIVENREFADEAIKTYFRYAGISRLPGVERKGVLLTYKV